MHPNEFSLFLEFLLGLFCQCPKQRHLPNLAAVGVVYTLVQDSASMPVICRVLTSVLLSVEMPVNKDVHKFAIQVVKEAVILDAIRHV